MLHPEVRAIVVNWVKTWLDDRTVYGTTDGIVSTIPDSVIFRYIPDGFELVFESNNELGITMRFESADYQFFEAEIVGQGAKIEIDNEHSDFYTVAIDGYIADVYESNASEHSSIVICHDENRNIFIIITGSIDVGELIKILENIEY